MEQYLFSNNPKIAAYLRYSVFFFVNGLFIFKYLGEHFSSMISVLLVLVYISVFLGVVYIYKRFNFSPQFYRYLFWILSILFFVIAIVINRLADPATLNTDRWMALENCIHALNHGKYPFDIPTFSGNEPSNLPVLILLGVPFFSFFGSVGYLQCAGFLIFVLVVYRFFKTYRERLFALMMMLLSPLRLQSKQPLGFSMFFLAFSVFLSFRVRNIITVMDWSGLVLFLTTLSVFVYLVVPYGINEAYYESGFDIGYFNTCIPFIIISLSLQNFLDKKSISEE